MESTEADRTDGTQQRGVIALLRALLSSGVDLAHNTAQMAASEGRVVLQRVAVRLGVFVAGLFVAAAGLLLALTGGALLLAQRTGFDPWVTCVAFGGATLLAGVVFAQRAMRRLGDADLAFPATLAELSADVAMLRRTDDASGDANP